MTMTLVRRFLFLLFSVSILPGFAVPARATNPDLLEARDLKTEEGKIGYRLFRPDFKKGSKELYPLIVFLHGSGERGDDNRAQIKYNFPELFITEAGQAKNPCFVMAPQCPKGASWSGDTLADVKGIIDSLSSEFPIDVNRLYLTGLSMGGRGVFNMLTEYPGLFAAAVPCAGGSDPEQIGTMMKTPMWLHCASKDRSIQHYYNLVEALKGKGEDVVWFKSNMNRSDANLPWDEVAAKVDEGQRFLFCEILDGVHQHSWLFAWENSHMPVWLFSKSKGAPKAQ